MKKHLLKALQFCLGTMLLCGLSSFRTSEKVNQQQYNRTALIVYDTIIGSDGKISQCKKEVPVESNQRDGVCFLEVHYDYDGYGKWYLYATNTYDRCVKVKYRYKKHLDNGDVFEDTDELIAWARYSNEQKKSGSLDEGVFELVDIIDACFNCPAPNN